MAEEILTTHPAVRVFGVLIGAVLLAARGGDDASSGQGNADTGVAYSEIPHIWGPGDMTGTSVELDDGSTPHYQAELVGGSDGILSHYADHPEVAVSVLDDLVRPYSFADLSDPWNRNVLRVLAVNLLSDTFCSVVSDRCAAAATEVGITIRDCG